MEIIVKHSTNTGRTDDWTATADGLRPGIGKTWGNAIESLFRANLPAFGVSAMVTDDPFDGVNPLVRWEADRPVSSESDPRRSDRSMTEPAKPRIQSSAILFMLRMMRWGTVPAFHFLISFVFALMACYVWCRAGRGDLGWTLVAIYGSASFALMGMVSLKVHGMALDLDRATSDDRPRTERLTAMLTKSMIRKIHFMAEMSVQSRRHRGIDEATIRKESLALASSSIAENVDDLVEQESIQAAFEKAIDKAIARTRVGGSNVP